MREMRARVAIVGIGEAGIGEVGAGISALQLMAEASLAALADCGLGKDDVDGLFSASSHYNFPTLELAEYLGLPLRYSDSSNIGGSSFLSHVLHAWAAIDAGLCTTALIAYGSTQRSDTGRLVTGSRPPETERPFRPRYPVSMYALAASRHIHEFGTTRQQLAEVAVAARAWANLGERAFARGPLTVADVLASRMVSSPLTVRDCCLVTDGAGAVVLTAADRARDLPRPPTFVLGAGESQTHRQILEMPDLTTTAARESGAQAFERAGLSPRDVDVVELYDAFTINTILFLEDLGFCPKGEGGPFVEDGRIAPGGGLPVNTNGGGLSYCHPGMYGIFLLTEATRQIQGVAGGGQQADVNVALAHGNGGVLSSHATVILGSEATQ
jgi:acetyl-CoA acetyltransferase